ncbi:hypothetical protein T4C_12187 [Trichinella pseudospiralis]|uniref:Uncharacterized protein n=1 Tax=Trichinella pseudospiralis TaxID=6337 RepID=A0A0V1JYH9_TRIPS|nr:hypothetical protein T4C_12187 [Trichinella pseudospiralis]
MSHCQKQKQAILLAQQLHNKSNLSSFVDDSEEKMDATKRIARLFNEYIFCSLSVG